MGAGSGPAGCCTELSWRWQRPSPVPGTLHATEPPRHGHCAGPGWKAQGGLFTHILGGSPPKKPPRSLVGCRAGMQGVLLAPSASAGPGTGTWEPRHQAGDPFPSQPLPLFASTPFFILFYFKSPHGAVAPLLAPLAPRSPGLSTKSCPARGWGQGQGQHQGGAGGAARCHPPLPTPRWPPAPLFPGHGGRVPLHVSGVCPPPLGHYK